tara:strand:- start:2644 stop:2922 length:279 start_codon:yes stop_codon:yes gene_type:complete
MPSCVTRHSWVPKIQRPLRKPFSTGHDSAVWGIWQQRECQRCGAINSRWVPGISASSPLEALDMARPTKAQQKREMDGLATIALNQAAHAKG